MEPAIKPTPKKRGPKPRVREYKFLTVPIGKFKSLEPASNRLTEFAREGWEVVQAYQPIEPQTYTPDPGEKLYRFLLTRLVKPTA